MGFTVRIISRPCGLTDKLMAIVPTIEKAWPHVIVETDISGQLLSPFDSFPRTEVLKDGHKQAVLHGFRTQQQHIAFISAIVDVDWVCGLAS
jgi:hypothetical protein